MQKHVGYIMHICNKHNYLLTQLKRQGLPLTHLQCVIILSHVCSACLERLCQCSRNRMFTAVDCKRLRVRILSQTFMLMLYSTIVIKPYLDYLYVLVNSLHHLFLDKREYTCAVILRPSHNFLLPLFKHQLARNSSANQ